MKGWMARVQICSVTILKSYVRVTRINFWKYRYNILYSVSLNRLRRNSRWPIFSDHPWNTMIKSEQHRNTMSTSGTLITQEYNFHLKPKSNNPISYFQTVSSISPVFLLLGSDIGRRVPSNLWRTRHQAWPWRPSIEPQKAEIQRIIHPIYTQKGSDSGCFLLLENLFDSVFGGLTIHPLLQSLVIQVLPDSVSLNFSRLIFFSS